MEKKYLAGKTLDELNGIVARMGMPRFTAGQIAAWLYEKRVRNIDEMTNLSKQNRERLAAEYEIGYSVPVEEMRSNIFLKRLPETLSSLYIFLIGIGRRYVCHLR